MSSVPLPSRRERLRATGHALLGDKLALLSVVLLGAIAVMAVVGPFLVPTTQSTLSLDTALSPPFHSTGGFWGILGSDQLGRDVLPRLILGTRTDLVIAVSAALGSAAIGGLIGITAGYLRGFVDAVLMRAMDVTLSFPTLLLAVVLIYLTRPSMSSLIVVLIIGRMPLYARVVRAATIESRDALFVDASRVLGASTRQVWRKDLFPVIVPTALTLIALDLGLLMLTGSALSFLGIGVQAPGVSLGLMVSEGQGLISTAWWLTVFPGAMIIAIALCCNLLSNWLRLVLDPAQEASRTFKLRQSVRGMAWVAGASAVTQAEDDA